MICKTCKQELPLSEFGKNKCYRDGLMRHCRACLNADRRSRYRHNANYRAIAARASKKWNAANHAKVVEYQSDYRDRLRAGYRPTMVYWRDPEGKTANGKPRRNALSTVRWMRDAYAISPSHRNDPNE